MILLVGVPSSLIFITWPSTLFISISWRRSSFLLFTLSILFHPLETDTTFPEMATNETNKSRFFKIFSRSRNERAQSNDQPLVSVYPDNHVLNWTELISSTYIGLSRLAKVKSFVKRLTNRGSPSEGPSKGSYVPSPSADRLHRTESSSRLNSLRMHPDTMSFTSRPDHYFSPREGMQPTTDDQTLLPPSISAEIVRQSTARPNDPVRSRGPRPVPIYIPPRW